MSLLIKDLPDNEKPRERFKKFGVENLSDEELIAIILRTGSKNESVKVLSYKVSNMLNELSDYKNLTLENLKNIKGIGEIKAITLLSAIELGRRTTKIKNNNKLPIINAKIIYDYYKFDLLNKSQEHLIAVFLNTKKEIINSKTIFIGTINNITIHAREIIKEAINNCAVFLIIIHNHPSGNPKPSNEDLNFTKNLVKVCKLVQIPLIDHIIFGNNTYYSFYDNGLVK